MFKWITLALASVAVLGLGWTINDLRGDLKQTVAVLNQNLPPILENTKKSTTTLAELSEDLRQLRDLAGATGPRDRSLVTYADSVLDFVEASGARIGLSKKIFGSGLKDVVPAKEWVIAARKEALWLTFRVKSREELLERLCKNMFGSAWHIEAEGAKPVRLMDWLRANHPESMSAQMTP